MATRSKRTAPKKKTKEKAAPVPVEEQQRLAKEKAVSDILGGKEAAAGAAGLADKLFSEGSLGRISTGFDASGNRIKENQDVLDSFKAKRELYGGIGQGRTAPTSEFLSRLKDSTQGYTSQENAAAREAMRRGAESNYKTSTRQLSDIAARSGISGMQSAALLAKAAKQRNRQLDENEQDLFIKDADERQSRLETYGGALQDIEGTEYDRSRQAAGDYADRLDTTRADEAERAKFNLGQIAQERGGYAGTLVGAANIFEQRKATRNQESLANKQLGLVRQQMGGSRRTSPTRRSSTTTTTGVNPKVQMIDDIINKTKSYYG